MYSLRINPQIYKLDQFSEFASLINIGKKDVLLANRFVYDHFIKPAKINCDVIHPKDYGSGEPSDVMIDAINEKMRQHKYKRIIAIGGGSVIDMGKILTLAGNWKAEDMYEGKIEPKKERILIAVPTTCGSGSEVTNSSVAELKSKGTKIALLNPQLYPDYAVLITDLLQTLPYKFFATSAIDALIHAFEATTSKLANVYSQLFADNAIRILLKNFMEVESKGQDSWIINAAQYQIASNFAGIAFSNSSVGAVHALSYPLGAEFHIPHGESNQLMFTAIYKTYVKMNPQGAVNLLEDIMAKTFSVSIQDVWNRLDNLLNKVMQRKPLSAYGINENNLIKFAKSVEEKQQRLLGNSYIHLTYNDILKTYKSVL